jgi:nucleoside-triphosphatase
VRIAITGKPRTGKTTLCERLFRMIKDDTDCDGFITKEKREHGRRVGFIFHELRSGEECWLSHVRNQSSIRVGKYGVYLENVDRMAEKLLEYRKREFVIIDEIGPMELKSVNFVRSVEKLMEGHNNLIFTIHLKSNHWLLQRIRNEFEVLIIDERNRDEMAYRLAEKILKRR